MHLRYTLFNVKINCFFSLPLPSSDEKGCVSDETALAGMYNILSIM